MKYENNTDHDENLHPKTGLNDSPDNKNDHHSIKLEEEKIEFIEGAGRPENFLGLKDMSSGDQGSIKYGCTEELEDALSSVQPGSVLQQKNNMMCTGSEDLEDMVRGYLKSGRVLESKLQKMSSIKHGTKSIE